MSNAAQAHSQFLQFCNDQISLLICGQTLSSNAKSTGLGSGLANLHGQVREDIIKYDRLCLNNILKHQLFRQYLDINMIKGASPNIVWGGSSTPQDNKDLSITLYNLYQSGITVSDESIDDLNVQMGLQLEKMETGQIVDKNGNPVGKKEAKEDTDEKSKKETDAEEK